MKAIIIFLLVFLVNFNLEAQVMPDTTGLISGDLVWSGSSGNDWSVNTNWLEYDGINFVVSDSAPSASDNVFIGSYGTSAVVITALSSCKNLTIESGKTLSLGSKQLNVSGNLTNNGTFDCGTGTINFSGTANQSIKAGGSFFYKALINNTTIGNADINITDPVVINNAITFVDGIIYFTGTGSLNINTSATANDGTATSFVDGPVSKIGKAEFIFPIGDAGVWAPIGIDALHHSSVVTANYNFTSPSDSDVCGGIDHASRLEYWNLSSNNDKSAVTLYWKDGARSGIQTPSDLVIVNWTGTCWKSIGNSKSTGNTSLGSISSNVSFSHNGRITFGTKKNDNPLPIELISFEGKCIDGNITLDWTTATETNNEYFTVEKSSEGLNWNSFQKVLGAGNSNETLNYSLTDKGSEGLNYYRLKQTDYNGYSEIFTSIAVSCKSEHSAIQVYPNPVVDILNIQTSAEETEVELSNIGGLMIFQGKVKTIDMTTFPAGLYLLKMTINGKVSCQKIIKQ